MEGTQAVSFRRKWGGIIRGKGLQARQARWAYTFLALSLFGLLVFSILPIVAAFGLSFMDWTLLSPPKLAGLSNFQRLQSDKIFWIALKNTLYYTLGVLPGIGISLLLAVLLNQKLRATTVFWHFITPCCAPQSKAQGHRSFPNPLLPAHHHYVGSHRFGLGMALQPPVRPC
jgi:hypothetical protein